MLIIGRELELGTKKRGLCAEICFYLCSRSGNCQIDIQHSARVVTFNSEISVYFLWGRGTLKLFL